MPQATNIVINDGATSPLAHTFVPSKVSDGVAVFYGPGSTLATREKITFTRREATATVAGKLNIKIELPIEQTVDGQVVLGYQMMSSMDFILAPKSVKQNRKDTRLLSRNVLDNALVAAMLDDMEFVF